MHVGLGDDEQDVLALFHRHAHDGGDRLHAELLHGLSRLLLVAVLLAPLRLLESIRFNSIRFDWLIDWLLWLRSVCGVFGGESFCGRLI